MGIETQVAYRLKPEVKQMWLAALRSGDYAQGRERLASVDIDGSKRFCCLGVLCEVAIADDIDVARSPHDGPNGMRYGVTYGGEDLMPPALIAEWAFDTTNRVAPLVAFQQSLVFDGDSGESLPELNDNGLTFAQIADIIEETL